MPPLVSIIIPFYNEEQYLGRALDSVLAQQYSPLELILVDDGSTDGSPAIAQAYGQQYPAIKLITTRNQGLGQARNTGMEQATGTYITFLDSDDALKESAIATWVAKIEAEQSDIVVSRFSLVNLAGSGEALLLGWRSKAGTGTGADGVRSMYEYRMSSTAWAKLYRTNIARQLHFPAGLWFEDRPFLLRYFLKTGMISYEESSQLDIYSRPHSITRKLLSERRISDAFAIYEMELDIVSGHEEGYTFTRLIDRHQINAMVEALILLYYDRKALPDVAALERCFALYTRKFISRLKQNGTRTGWRDKEDLLLIRLHSLLGWPVTFLILPWWKRKKCKAVLKLKSF